MTTATDLRDSILAAVVVDHATIAAAKAYLRGAGSSDTDSILRGFAEHVIGGPLEQPVIVHPSRDLDAATARVARWIAAQRALAAALWALIGSGDLVPVGAFSEGRAIFVSWTTVIPGSGGDSSGWNFGGLPVLPQGVEPTRGLPADPDLYLRDLGEFNLDATVVESLRQAVACFRADLFLPAQVMLGRAIEGAWITTGVALARSPVAPAHAAKVGDELEAGSVPLVKIPGRVRSLATDLAYAPFLKAAGVTREDLERADVWTDVLRRARNAVHHGAEAAPAATWETTTALLMGIGAHLRVLNALATAAVGAVPDGQGKGE